MYMVSQIVSLNSSGCVALLFIYILQANCRQYNGHLVHVNDAEENDFIKTHISTDKVHADNPGLGMLMVEHSKIKYKCFKYILVLILLNI